MKKQKGFTLIELMVVMAIIAILATAGLSAYTGYIKKARDTTRIADINAINTIIQWSLSANGSPPASMDSVVSEANNGQMLTDPLGTTAVVCLTDATTNALGACGYTYSLCDDGAGYLITAKLESKSNQTSYTTNGSAVGYSMGSCTSGATGGSNTILVDGKNWMPTDLWGSWIFYQWKRVAPVTEADWSGGDAASWIGNGAGSGDPCTADNPNTRMPNNQELSELTPEDIVTLGLTMNGYLDAGDGVLSSSGTFGYYWSSGGSFLYFYSGGRGVDAIGPAYGFSVRCLQN